MCKFKLIDGTLTGFFSKKIYQIQYIINKYFLMTNNHIIVKTLKKVCNKIIINRKEKFITNKLVFNNK